MTTASCALIFIGLGGLVALDGSPQWQLVRLLVVAGACLAVAFAERSPRKRLAAVALVALGVVATPVGAVIAFSHLGTTGLSIESACGVLALVGGLGAIVRGSWVLLRATRRWYRLFAVPIALVVVYFVVLPITVAVFATNVPRPELGSATPADRGLRYTDAVFATADGVELSGWYIPSRNRAAVVLAHGASSTRSNVLAQAEVLARHGYGVLLFDARGHGRSEGRAMEFGWHGDEDISAAVTYLRDRPDVDPRRIGAVGMSMGGEEVIGAIAGDERIAAAVAEGATIRTFDDNAWIVDEHGARGRIQRGVDRLTFTLSDLLTSASPPISLREAVTAAAPRPVLLIAAGNVADEPPASRAIQAASPDTVEVWIVPGVGHTDGLRSRPDDWERRVTRFLDDALLQSRPGD